MLKMMKYRIYPTKKQVEILEQQLALCCELYNAALQERRDAWRLNRVSISYFDQSNQIPEIKKLRPELAEMNAHVVRTALKRVDRAFQGFFRRCRRGEAPGFPRFKAVHRYDSLTFLQVRHVLAGGKLRVSKVGQVRIKLHRPVDGEIKEMHIRREAGHWFAVFSVFFEPLPPPTCADRVGIDVGLAAFATLNDGTEIENPRWFHAAEAKLRREQRRVARRKKGSCRRRKAVILLQRLYAHVRRQRADYHHKISRWLVNNHGLIAVENLNIKGLAGSVLAKSVNDAGWSAFIDKLAYKAEWAGRVLVKVDCRGTSQTCPCGAEVRKALKERWHNCESCGLSLPRDHVSAQLILGRAMRLQALTSPVTECVA